MWTKLSSLGQEPTFNSLEVEDKIFVCKFSKNVKSKLYYVENSKTEHFLNAF